MTVVDATAATTVLSAVTNGDRMTTTTVGVYPSGTPGVGAWSRPQWYGLDTAGPKVADQRIHYAVHAIQRALPSQYGASPSGVFDTTTDTAVRGFQRDAGATAVGPVDGLVGPRTGRALFRPLAYFFEVVNDRHVVIPGHYLAGLVGWESGGYDPGAQGGSDANDRGLAQVNALAHPDVSDATAYGDPVAAIVFACHALIDAYVRLGGWRFAIAAYNNPAAAAVWSRGGTPSADMVAYVGHVMNLAAAGG